MNRTNKVLSFVVFICVLVYSAETNALSNKEKSSLSAGQKQNFQQEMAKAEEQYSHLKKGDKLFAKGEIDQAIKEYEISLSLADHMTRGVVYFSLANAYEKKRDYRKALEYVRKDLETFVSDWAKGPEIEREKYLEYVLRGDYGLAIEHARKAFEEDRKLPNTPKEGNPDYIERLNDLIAAKDYILSLKENGAGK
jgi:tetratricopeptide (TPR) repeat protein